MSGFEAEVLANQLAALGRDLQAEVIHLGELEEESVDAEGGFRKLKALHEDNIDRAFLGAEGSVGVREAVARISCGPSRDHMLDAQLEWNRMKGRVSTQQANLSAIHRRIELGRSLLSREKALISLAGTGEV